MVPQGKLKWIPPFCATTPNMRNCITIEELVLVTFSHLHVLSPCNMSAFWTALSKKHVKNQGGRPLRMDEHGHGHNNEKLDKILVKTLENIGGYYNYKHRDLMTTALSLAKIVKQVGCVSGKEAP
jgi:hypothetical protein